MAVSNSRNELQASIEDNATMLICIVQEIDLFYKQRLLDISNQIEKTKNEIAAECPEALSSMLSQDYQMIEWYEELFQQILQSFILKVYSYADKHIKGLLARINCTINDAQKQYRKEYDDIKGVSDIEKGCYYLCKHYDFSFEDIWSIWPGFKTFHSLRVDIEHKYKVEYSCLSVDNILTTIAEAKEFLSALERLTRCVSAFEKS